MKTLFLSLTLLVGFTLSAQHSLTISYNDLRINEAYKKFDKYKDRKIQIWNRDTSIVLDTLGDSLFTLHILPVVISDGKTKWLEFGIHYFKKDNNPFEPNWNGVDSGKISSMFITEKNFRVEYSIKVKFSADPGLLKNSAPEVIKEPLHFTFKSYNLTRNHRHINTSKNWPKEFSLGSNEKSDTFWTGRKKAQYGLVLETVTRNYNGQNFTKLNFIIYEHKKGKIHLMTENHLDVVVLPLESDNQLMSGSSGKDKYVFEIRGISVKS